MTMPVDDISLTPDEQAVVASFRESILRDSNLSPSVTDEMVVQFLMARKFEQDRAFELLINSLRWRRDRGIGLYQPLTPKIAQELKTKKVVIPPMSRDRDGGQVVYYRPALARKHDVKAADFCLSIFYLLQRCIQDPVTQRKGFLFICDLRGTKLLQVDRKLVKSILDMLSNKFPARLKKVLLLEPPAFFNLAFRIVRPVIPTKYLDKLALGKLQDLHTYIDKDKLLPDYGGTLAFDASAYVDTLYNEEQARLQQQVQTSYMQPSPPPSKLEEWNTRRSTMIREGNATF